MSNPNRIITKEKRSESKEFNHDLRAARKEKKKEEEEEEEEGGGGEGRRRR